MIPPRSPYGLIQEDLWPDSWKILVSCVLLNCTTRRAMEKVVPKLFDKYPNAVAMARADKEELAEMISPLGFRNRRSERLISLSKAFTKGDWSHAKELPGVGDYAAAAWEIFVLGKMPEKCPDDHALVRYYNWRKRHGY